MNIKLVDGSIYELSDLSIENDILNLDFVNKTADEVKTILSNPANLNTIIVLDDNTQEDLVFYYNYSVFSGIYISPEGTIRGMLSQQKDDTLQRIIAAESKATEAINLVNENDSKISEMDSLLQESFQPAMLSIAVASIAAQSFSDEDAATVKYIYPTYTESIGKTIQQNYKMVHEDILYKVIQPTLEITAERIPGSQGMESLYTVIDEKHAGTQEDPIPYSGNMELEANKYYTQNGVLYKCTRGTGQPVYHQLSDLVGIYVEIVSK